MTSLIKCPTCGSKNEPEERACSGCGVSLPDQGRPKVSRQQVEEDAAPKHFKGSKPEVREEVEEAAAKKKPGRPKKVKK